MAAGDRRCALSSVSQVYTYSVQAHIHPSYEYKRVMIIWGRGNLWRSCFADWGLFLAAQIIKPSMNFIPYSSVLPFLLLHSFITRQHGSIGSSERDLRRRCCHAALLQNLYKSRCVSHCFLSLLAGKFFELLAFQVCGLLGFSRARPWAIVLDHLLCTI